MPVGLTAETRLDVEADVELARILVSWPTPPRLKPGDRELDFLGLVLASGKSSRLYKKLVYELQIAQDIAAIQESGQLASTFEISVTVRKGKDPKQALSIVDEELAKLRTTPPSQAEVERARARLLSSLIFGMERVTSRAKFLQRVQSGDGRSWVLRARHRCPSNRSAERRERRRRAVASSGQARGDAGYAHRRRAPRRQARRREGSSGCEPEAGTGSGCEAESGGTVKRPDSDVGAPRRAHRLRRYGPAAKRSGFRAGPEQPAATVGDRRRILSQAGPRAGSRARFRATEDRAGAPGQRHSRALGPAPRAADRRARNRARSRRRPGGTGSRRVHRRHAASRHENAARARAQRRAGRARRQLFRLHRLRRHRRTRAMLVVQAGRALADSRRRSAKPGIFASRDRTREKEAADHTRSTEGRAECALGQCGRRNVVPGPARLRLAADRRRGGGEEDRAPETCRVLLGPVEARGADADAGWRRGERPRDRRARTRFRRFEGHRDRTQGPGRSGVETTGLTDRDRRSPGRRAVERQRRTRRRRPVDAGLRRAHGDEHVVRGQILEPAQSQSEGKTRLHLRSGFGLRDAPRRGSVQRRRTRS